MAFKRYYTIVCDGCGVERTNYLCESPRQTRSYAKQVGWVRITGRHATDGVGRDLCPKCHNESKPTPEELEQAK